MSLAAAAAPAIALDAADPSAAPRDYLTVALGDDLFAMPVELVHEVLDPPPVTRVPNAPRFAPGLVNVRGNVLPLVDLRARFGLPAAADTPASRVIVSEVQPEDGEPFQVAIKTDAVFEVMPVRRADVAAMPENGARWPSRFLDGVVRQDGRFVTLIDVAQVFRDA